MAAGGFTGETEDGWRRKIMLRQNGRLVGSIYITPPGGLSAVQ